MDLSSDQDLTMAIMNLISIEEHFLFTGVKTEKTCYYDLLKEIREIRKTLLKEIVTEYEGEVWCISKHLLAASMRLMEVGTKQLGMGNDKKAYEFFQKAFDLYSLFWGVNTNLINTKDLKKISTDYDINDENLANHDDDETQTSKKRTSIVSKLGSIVKNARKIDAFTFLGISIAFFTIWVSLNLMPLAKNIMYVAGLTYFIAFLVIIKKGK